ncbi:hypothetical protein SAMN02800694_1862 [Luteibacter sp. UNCMF331Sha3.1]|uniref:hypothetical protein n=1 Tax=Luteibacter sp. UNCMF331Sha3.1 TaxID=1502760 RepID=UPI0008CD3812|nr:hypothetical protein [Luteibacter sp. UNCMF331Sha3.1]SEM83841.1 hypothetical protein SAMN02800694_1862 [Luteibacter sp. UNCMF331Sha3.1]
MNARPPTTIEHDFDPSEHGEWTAFEPRSLREFVCVLAERMRQMATRSELRAVEHRLGARIDGIEVRIDSLDARMDGLDARMDRLETRMDGLDVRMAGIESSVATLSGRVGVLEERVSHTATKTWVLSGVVATLISMAGCFWWIAQQYLAPLLRAAS